jgi:uncharacterized protein YegP (UPF0339 family)
MPNKKSVVIVKGRSKRSKEFRFKLLASNGQNLSDREFYKRKSTLIKMLKKNFPGFKIVDQTKKNRFKRSMNLKGLTL